MNVLRVAPKIDVDSHRVHGRTPWQARLLVLFLYCRTVTVDRQRRQVLVTTQWLWFWRSDRIIPFDRVARIIYRAQELPSFSPIRYLGLLGANSDFTDSAVFLISLAIKDAAEDKRAHEELTLFSVWEQLPRERNWVDKLAGIHANAYRVGDETSGAIVALLHEYLGVPVASH